MSSRRWAGKPPLIVKVRPDRILVVWVEAERAARFAAGVTTSPILDRGPALAGAVGLVKETLGGEVVAETTADAWPRWSSSGRGWVLPAESLSALLAYAQSARMFVVVSDVKPGALAS